MKYKKEFKFALIMIVVMIIISIMMIWFIIAFEYIMQYLLGNLFTSAEYQMLGLLVYGLSLIYISINLFKK